MWQHAFFLIVKSGRERLTVSFFFVGLGKNLAWHEMRLILASTLLRFDLELCEESRGWIDQKIFLLWDKPELFCILTSAKE